MTPRLPRRNLLAALACTPLAAAASATGREAPSAPPQPAPEALPPRPATYRETEHTRRYYRSAARL